MPTGAGGAGGPTDPRLRRLRCGYTRRPRAGRAPPTLPRFLIPTLSARRCPGSAGETDPERRGVWRAPEEGVAHARLTWARWMKAAPLTAHGVWSSCARAGASALPQPAAPSGALGFRRRSERKEGKELVGAEPPVSREWAGMGRDRAPALRGGRLRPRRPRRPREAPLAPPAGIGAREAGPAALEWEGTRERGHRSPESARSLVAQCSLLVLLPLPAL